MLRLFDGALSIYNGEQKNIEFSLSIPNIRIVVAEVGFEPTTSWL